jgi:neurotransmitter:Na+ symporter, NSS family
VVFALGETILYSWIFGVNKGWDELTTGADIQLPSFYKYIILIVTPLLLSFVFLGSLITPVGNDWSGQLSSLFSGNGWALDNGSLIKQIANAGLREQIAAATDPDVQRTLSDKLLYINGARALLTALFLSICLLVYVAFVNRQKTQKA